jgi:hypothetical protein
MTAAAGQPGHFHIRREAARPWTVMAGTERPAEEPDAPETNDGTTQIAAPDGGAPPAGERPTTPYAFTPGQYGHPTPGQLGGPPQYGPPPGQFGPPGQYGGPPPAYGFGPPLGQYGGPPPPEQYSYPPPPGQYGYPPPGQPYGGPPPAPKRRRRTVIALVVAAVLLVVAAGTGFWFYERSARTVALLTADAPGDEPFTPTLVQGGTTVPTVRFDAANTTPVGGLDGLYLDSTGSAACDRTPLKSALRDPGLAAVWAAPLGVAAPAAPQYVTGLTPVRLRADTRLTAHRNSGGEARPYAATLQAGTAVLVDDRGRPRVRCADGAPLGDARPVDGPIYSGGWAGFDPAAVIEIRPAAGRVAEFGLVDAAGEEPFRRPAGTAGEQDVVVRPDTGRLDGSYFMTGNQTGCEGLVDCTRAGALTLISRFSGCPAACEVSDPEIGDGVPLTRDGAVWRAGGDVPTDHRAGRCDGQQVPYTFTTTFTVTDSQIVDGVWTATRLTADHEVRAQQTANCVSAVISWTVTGSGGGS